MAKKKTKKKTASKKTATKKTAAKKPARRGLSRGLGALLSSASRKDAPAPEPVKVAVPTAAASGSSGHTAPAPVAVDTGNGTLTTLPVEMMQRGRYQPRQSMKQAALEELAESIKQQGIMQPIVVRAVSKDKYEIIAGERRWRAAQLAQLAEVPVIIRKIKDEDAIAMSLIENIQREDLNPLDEAIALHRLVDEFQLTHGEVATAVGRSRTSVTNLLRLLELDPSVKKLVADGLLSMGHARALLSLTHLKQLAAAKDIVKKGLSVRATEQLVRSILKPKDKKSTSSAKAKDADIQRLESDLTDKLGARVSIENKKGKGKLIIEYSSLDELDGILNKIG